MPRWSCRSAPRLLGTGNESAKRLESLKRAVPSITRVSVVWTGSVAPYFAQTASAARALALDVVSREVNAPGELDPALDRVLAASTDRYVGRILKGTRPGDVPVELPTQYEIVINLNAAQALGTSISEEVLFQATQVIQ